VRSSLSDVDRPRVLRELGLGARADARLDGLAQRLRTALRVPAAFVSLRAADRQVLPGQCGLDAPLRDTREMSSRHSFCRLVVDTGEPLVVTDARTDPRTAGNPAIETLGVLGYAGCPVVDGAGRVLGTVCVLDTAPHDWVAEELAEVQAAADVCSTELQLRLARHDAEAERARASELRELLTRSLRRSQLLLSASRALSNVVSVNELRDRITEIVASDLAPSSVELIITEHLDSKLVGQDRRGHRTGEWRQRVLQSGQWHNFDVNGPALAAQAVRGRRTVHYSDLRASGTTLPDSIRMRHLDRGVVAVVCAPIMKGDRVLGVLELGWGEPHDADLLEQAAIAVIAGYVATALEGARYVQRKIGVADELQRAMLTALPEVPGLTMAASYVPAAMSQRVGGDWYDAFVLPARDGVAGTVAVVVGDVSGHDMTAATVMGQLRAMLRQSIWQVGPVGSAAGAMTALDRAITDLDIGTLATVVLGLLRKHPDGSPRWSMTWTNAGHPPPIVVRPDRSVDVLDAPEHHDHLVGAHALIGELRHDHEIVLEPGSTVLFYTDGLIERRDTDIDDAISELAGRMAHLHDTAPQTITTQLISELQLDSAPDDIAILVVRVDDH
jgi:serine phosphatase RsbU (regulator of sigma subunit)